LFVFFAVNTHQGAFIATAEAVRSMKMNKMPEVILIQVLLNHFNKTFIAPRKARATETNLDINFLLH
jgi:hypothetical protein